MNEEILIEILLHINKCLKHDIKNHDILSHVSTEYTVYVDKNNINYYESVSRWDFKYNILRYELFNINYSLDKVRVYITYKNYKIRFFFNLLTLQLTEFEILCNNFKRLIELKITDTDITVIKDYINLKTYQIYNFNYFIEEERFQASTLLSKEEFPIWLCVSIINEGLK